MTTHILLQIPLIQKLLEKVFFDIHKYLNINNKINKKSRILEIGSNDGYLLSQFKNKNFPVLGIDASKKMCQIANKKRIKTLNLLFNFKNSKK